ncbi:MAG: cryptochrome/photolyase family protein [Rhodobiaceae bacterium]|jgi:deoxyribodipyrimidine photolyase-related protein|nr:cryptochrome/photolyase family protein [Rhodobiaceae bacterium]MDG2496453.1 cryptochrome/photolyase family protein [Alphaproteobacteria bacterium]
MTDLILVLGDQLSPHLSSLQAAPDAHVVMAELYDEATYVAHHQQKLVLVFSAMRHFAESLRQQGREVTYIAYGETPELKSFTDVVAQKLASGSYQRLFVTEPGEYRLASQFADWATQFNLPVHILPDTRFIASHDEFQTWASGKKQLRMEFFYREMRRKTGLLMDDKEPLGGQWNYDAENRKKLPKGHVLPARLSTPPDALTRDVMALVTEHFGSGETAHFGTLEGFGWPVTAQQAEAQFDDFLDHCLPQFGDYQDAMKSGETFMYHALIATSLNLGLLDPLDVCRAAEARLESGQAPLNAVEGFIRQILGWREYIRGIYWLKMPDYEQENFFDHDRALPDFFYSGDTDMACLREAVTASQTHAYAHHIQRLMITGNFALLAGLAPEAVNRWYMEVYADAYQWVQLPNTHGMALFADGGLVASKPYVSSGAYINRMSDYCKDCRYQVKQPNGDDACPFNYLYWDFMMRHADTLSSNPRMGMVYRNLEKMDEAKKAAAKTSAAKFLETLK